MGEAALQLRRLTLECEAAASPAQLAAFAARFAKIARSRLADALQEQLATLDARGGDAVVLIERLALEFDVDLLLAEREIAVLWASKMKQALAKLLQSRSGAEVVMIYDSPAHHLAAFLSDCLRGDIRHWYYRQFEGLWALPSSAALRTALCADPGMGRAALQLLSIGELTELCAALTPADARQTTQMLYAQDERQRAPGVEEAVAFVRGIEDKLDRLVSELKDEAQTLLLCVLAGDLAPMPTAVVWNCARLMSVLLTIRNRAPGRFERTMQELRQGRRRELLAHLQVEEAALLLPLAPAVTEVFLSVFASKVSPSLAGSVWTHASTWFGNAFLLLPQLQRLPLASVAEWEPLLEQAPLRVLRWLLLCLCQGQDRFLAATRDPLLRDLCGVPPTIDLTALMPWLDAQLSAARIEALFAALRSVAQEQARSTEQVLLERDGTLYLVTREKETARWLALRPLPEQPMDLEVSDEDSVEASDFASLWPARLVCADPVKGCLCTLAQFTLKSLAARLPGFATSSVNHLLRNFLCMSATLVAEDAHIDVALTRVPLSVILNISGLNRGTLSLPEFDPRPLRLHESN